jgi:pyridoxamine 5'-phosphate oxidase
MNKSEILAFLEANPSCYLATVEGNKPHVRGIRIFKADENGIIFQTSKTKDLHKQLSENPNAELCFYSRTEGIQIRVSGTVEVVEDADLDNEIIAKRSFLKSAIENEGYELVVYRLKKAVATIWTLQTNLVPKTYTEL